MSQVRCVALALAGMGIVALTASTADAQYGPYRYSRGPYASYGYGWGGGPTYSYGANRANGSISPNGLDQDNPRDFQLQGTR
jgi:hypothetical protein